ncbi:MAG: ABC transporter substrate-binding protein [Anaerolineae bacterium]
MKKLMPLLWLTVILLLVVACGGGATPAPTEPPAEQPTQAPVSKEGEPYTLGMVASVTGPISFLGVPERDTGLMLMEKINAAGGIKGPDGLMHKLEVLVEDDATDTGKAVLAAKKLIEQDQVQVLIGSSGSPASIAMVEVATEAEVPMISMASSSAIVNPVPERFWIFKTPQENLPVAQVQADYWKAKGVTRVASLGVNNAFGQDSRNAMQQVYGEAGIEIVADELFQPGDKDFRAQLTKIKGLNPEGLVVHATPGEGAPVTVQFRELGFDIPIVHNHGIGSRGFIDLAGDAAEGVLFPIGKLLVAEGLPDGDPQKATLLEYIQEYTDYTNGQPRSTFGGHAWDAVMMSVHCLEKVGPDAAKLRGCFESDLTNFIGISGIFNISDTDHVGISKESLVLVEIQNGEWVYVSPDDYAQAPVLKEGEPYTLGMVASVTGPISFLGVPERDTGLMLMEKINAAGGIKGPDGLMHKLEVLVEDDATDTGKAVLAAKKLIEQDQVQVLIGSSGSPASIAMVEVATEAEVPMISMASSSAIVNPVPERFWIFKTPQENLPVAQVQADYWKAKGVTRVASLGVNNAFGQDSRNAMQQVYGEAGIEIVADELFQPGDKDFRAQLTKIKGLNPEGLVVHATPGEGAPVTVQFRELGFDIPIVHNHGIGSRGFIDLAGDAAEGVLFPIGKLLVAEGLPDGDPQKATLLEYIQEYTDYTNGQPRSTFGGHAWDAVMMSVHCLEKVGPDAAKLRGCFESDLTNFIGISGIFNISDTDHVGISKESLVLVEIQNGEWVYVSPDDYAEAP